VGVDILMASHDILIRSGWLWALDRSDGDVTGLPEGASLILENDWKQMCEAAGGEKALIAALGAEDMRDE